MRTMNLVKIVLGVAVMMAAVAGAATAATAVGDGGLVYTTSGDVEPGVWTDQFTKAKKLADSKHIPLIVAYCSPGCGLSQTFQYVAGTSSVSKQLKSGGYLLVFGHGKDESESLKAYNFAKNSTRKFPYVAFYWKKSSSTQVYASYTGRIGAMYDKTGNSLGPQFVNTARYWFAGYSPSSSSSTTTVTDLAVSLTVKGTGTVFAGMPVAEDLFTVSTASDAKISSVSGLPSGVAYSTKTDLFSGVPKKAGTYTVKAVAKRGKKKVSATATLVVRPLPDFAVGKFQGAVYAGKTVAGLADFTVTAAGKVSGRFKTAEGTWTLSCSALDLVTASACSVAGTAKKLKQTQTVSLKITANGLTGSFGANSFEACSAVWTADRKKELKAALKVLTGKTSASQVLTGAAYGLADNESLTVKLSSDGTLSVAAVFDTGTVNKKGNPVFYKTSARAVLLEASVGSNGVSGRAVLYFAPKTGKFDGYARIVEMSLSSGQGELN